jgi:hypothetical protein
MAALCVWENGNLFNFFCLGSVENEINSAIALACGVEGLAYGVGLVMQCTSLAQAI